MVKDLKNLTYIAFKGKGCEEILLKYLIQNVKMINAGNLDKVLIQPKK